MLVLDQSSHYDNQNFFLKNQHFFMIQFCSDFASKNENGILAIL
jgi:hypothetical protein